MVISPNFSFGASEENNCLAFVIMILFEPVFVAVTETAVFQQSHRAAGLHIPRLSAACSQGPARVGAPGHHRRDVITSITLQVLLKEKMDRSLGWRCHGSESN